MIAFQINGEFLDLNPNTVLELEEENPFIQLGNEIVGQYSLPFTAPLTAKNMRLLGYPNIFSIKKRSVGIDALLFTNGLQHSRGQVKIETGTGNINQPARGSVSLYYLFGVADFYKLVENKTLRDVDYGNDIVYPWSYLSEPGGFGEHIRDVMRNGNPDRDRYAFFPVVNSRDPVGSRDVDIMNFISYDAGFPGNVRIFSGRFCPFLYLHFIISRVFASVGWTVEGAPLSDADFRKITVIYNAHVNVYTRLTTQEIRYNLRDHVPGIKIGSFLVAIMNRFGLWYNFDYRKKVCTLSYRLDVFKSRNRKDFTSKVIATYNFKLNGQERKYALTQLIGGEPPSFAGLHFAGVINTTLQLPAATESTIDQYYFVQAENSYYLCSTNQNEVPEWQKSAGNTFDYLPKDNTDSIPTSCLVPDSTVRNVINWSEQPTPYRIVVPVVDLDPDFGGGTDYFYVAYHHGTVSSVNNANLPNFLFPFASAGCHDLHGNIKAKTALVFEYKGSDGEERGLIARYWDYFLKFLGQREEVSIQVRMSLQDILNLRYTDTILIRNTEFFVKNPHITLPVKASNNMELIRI